MKILDDNEKSAHRKAVLLEGAKGTVVGLGVSFALVNVVKRRSPANWARFTTTMKSAMWAMPTIALGAFYADEGSVKFDEAVHRSDYLIKQEKEKLEKWNELSLEDKCFTRVNDNKYKIIVGAWAASLYGSWRIVNKDKYLTTAQKAVQARVYAQAITVVLLLSTILLSMHEQKLKAKQAPEVPEWKRFLDEQEYHKQEALRAENAS